MSRASLLAGGLVLAAVAVVFSLTGRAGGGTPVSLIVSGGTVVTMNAANEVITDGAVAIDGARIVAVGTTAAITETYSAARRIDATGRIVMPGLINTHTHAPMVLYRGLADDLALMDWLTQYIFPAEKATVSPDMVRVGTQLAALEMIESGTTTFADMYYFEETIAQAAADAGIRGVLGQTIIKFPVADAPTPEDALARTEVFLREWSGHELITPAVAPHAPYTLTPETLRATRALADKYRVPLLIHLAETKDEVATIAAEQRATPTMFLEQIGLWNGPTVAAHAVWVDDADLKVLAARGVGLSHNPESNMKLSSGTARVPAWLDAGAKSGLGTDGAASNNDLDMFEAMRMAALLHKHATGDPRTLPARQVLQLATRGGAAVLGMGDRVGSLEAGKLADLITIDVNTARQTPLYDPESHLVYASRGDDVRDTIINGRVVMRDRRVMTMDKARVLADARAMAAQVRAAVAAGR